MSTPRTTGRKLVVLRKQVFATYGDTCWLCGGDGADTIDHLIKLAHGGTDDLDNLRPAHGRRSANCVGNFSGRRDAFPRSPRPKSEKLSEGITFSEDGQAIVKRRGQLTCTLYWRFMHQSLDDPDLIAWMNS